MQDIRKDWCLGGLSNVNEHVISDAYTIINSRWCWASNTYSVGRYPDIVV